MLNMLIRVPLVSPVFRIIKTGFAPVFFVFDTKHENHVVPNRSMTSAQKPKSFRSQLDSIIAASSEGCAERKDALQMSTELT